MIKPFLARTPFGLPAIGRTPVLFFEPDAGTGGGGGSPAPQGDANLQEMLRRTNGDAMALAGQLYAELTATRARVPAAGSVVLPAADAANYEAFRALGDPAALAQKLKDAEAHAGELATIKRQQLLNSVAEIGDGTNKYKASVLGQLPGADKLAFDVRDLGGDKKAVVVKTEAGEVGLADYAKQHWADFLPSLMVAAQGTPAPQPIIATWPTQPSGAPAPQGGQSTLGEASFNQFQAARDAKTNPMNPTPATTQK